MKKIDIDFNVQTGEETVIERDETKEEKEQRLADEKKVAERLAEAQAKEVARQAIADRLGLTADELKLLFG